MSLLKTITMFVKYKQWANKITFESLSTLPPSELCKERQTNFKTILSTLNHVYVIDDIFKCHLTSTAHSYTSRNTQETLQLSELAAKQALIDQWYLDYIASITESDIDRTVSFNFIGGGAGNMTVSEIVLHVVNHGSYHRGFVSDMMYQVPVRPAANDLTVYLRDVHYPQ